MPTAVKFVARSADAEYEARMSWTFKAKLADLPDEKVYSPELKGMPLIGRWSLSVYADGGTINLDCAHGSLPEGVLGERVFVTFRLEVLCDGQAKFLASASWEPDPLPDLIDPESESSQTYTGFRQDFGLPKIIKDEPWFKPLAKKSQTCSVTVSLRRSAHRPFGPSGSLAKQASLLAAQEDVKPIIDLADDDGEAKDWDDSDDETDAYFARAGGAQPEDADLDVEYRQITIKGTAFTTYRAVMFYLKSGYIAFAPLRSSFSISHPSDEHASRTDFLLDHTEEKPELPLPASPKSVYRLAHLLGLEELQKLALASLSTSLTVSGAISELFSPVSMAYDELRKILRDFVLEHLDAIRSNPAWKAREARANRGELEGPALVTMELLMAVLKTKEKRRT